MIQVYSNSLGKEELDAVEKVFASKWIGKAKECESFEKELGKYWGVKNVLLVNNCTAGIYIALKAIGIKQGDEVIISTINFVACANAVIEMGGIPVFADVDMYSLNVLPSEIVRLKSNRTKAVIILHYGGVPADIPNILRVCENVPIIEDNANSIVSTYNGCYCGTFGAISVCSFDGMKILSMGDGGAIVVNDEKYLEKITAMRYLGYPKTTVSGLTTSKENDKWWEYDVHYPSGRFISNDILAAIGRVQLIKLPSFIERRKQIWDIYQKELNGLPLIECPQPISQNCTSSYYMYWLRVNLHRNTLARHLYDKGIYTNYRYFPLHLVKGYGSNQKLKNAEHNNDVILNIPLHQNLTDNDVDKIITTIKEFVCPK